MSTVWLFHFLLLFIVCLLLCTFVPAVWARVLCLLRPYGGHMIECSCALLRLCGGHVSEGSCASYVFVEVTWARVLVHAATVWRSRDNSGASVLSIYLVDLFLWCCFGIRSSSPFSWLHFPPLHRHTECACGDNKTCIPRWPFAWILGIKLRLKACLASVFTYWAISHTESHHVALHCQELLHLPGWPWTRGNPPASVSQVLGLQVWTGMPRSIFSISALKFSPWRFWTHFIKFIPERFTFSGVFISGSTL